MKTLIVLALAILFAAQSSAARAQSEDWRVYSPRRSGFSVETPAPLRRVMSFDGDHGANLEPDQNIEWATCYAAIEGTPAESRFGIIVINHIAREMFLRSLKREKYLQYLSWLFFADDDELQFMRAPVAVKHNGLTGKEYLYIKESSYGDLYTRGRIFDTGNKTYVIVFVGQSIKTLLRRTPSVSWVLFVCADVYLKLDCPALQRVQSWA